MIGKEIKKNSKVNRPNDTPLGKKKTFLTCFLTAPKPRIWHCQQLAGLSHTEHKSRKSTTDLPTRLTCGNIPSSEICLLK